MITIYRQSWNDNAKCLGTVDADQAAEMLRKGMWDVVVVDGACPNEDLSCETDTDAEELALEIVLM